MLHGLVRAGLRSSTARIGPGGRCVERAGRRSASLRPGGPSGQRPAGDRGVARSRLLLKIGTRDRFKHPSVARLPRKRGPWLCVPPSRTVCHCRDASCVLLRRSHRQLTADLLQPERKLDEGTQGGRTAWPADSTRRSVRAVPTTSCVPAGTGVWTTCDRGGADNVA
jgi:hypothetical protein